MRISVRGWIGVGILAAAASAVYLYTPLLNAQETAPAPEGQFTEESLGNALQAMGLKPKKVKSRYDFRFKTSYEGEEWTFTMSAVLSRNKEYIWMMAWLDELPRSAAKVPRASLLQLLSINDQLGKGTFFAYISNNRRIVLQRVIPNKDMGTASFRDELRDLGSFVVETYPHWSVAQWSKGSGSVSQTAGNSGPRKAPTRTATNKSKFESSTRK